MNRIVELAHRTLGMVMRRVSRWMVEHGFFIPLETTEAVVLTKEKVPAILLIQAGETMFLWKRQ